MAQRRFTVRAIWDAEASVWIADSDIIGLHVEAPTLSEFQDLVGEFAADLIVANHFSADDLENSELRDLIPAVVIQECGTHHAAE